MSNDPEIPRNYWWPWCVNTSTFCLQRSVWITKTEVRFGVINTSPITHVAQHSSSVNITWPLLSHSVFCPNCEEYAAATKQTETMIPIYKDHGTVREVLRTFTDADSVEDYRCNEWVKYTYVQVRASNRMYSNINANLYSLIYRCGQTNNTHRVRTLQCAPQYILMHSLQGERLYVNHKVHFADVSTYINAAFCEYYTYRHTTCTCHFAAKLRVVRLHGILAQRQEQGRALYYDPEVWEQRNKNGWRDGGAHRDA